MQRQTTLSIWCERIIEAGWLLCIALIPLYFNLFSARHFEPDKATTLRAIVLVMAALGVIRMLERFSTSTNARAPSDEPVADGNPFGDWLRRFNHVPLAVPTLVYVAVFILTTLTSVVPLTSFWGSYQRLQGTYTNLSYVALFVIIVVTMRRTEQLERLVTVALATCVGVAGYGVLQHQGLDPLPWLGDVVTRVASTMGNSIFVASYMLMILPLALYRFFKALHEARHAPPSSTPANDLLWALANTLLIFGSLVLLLSAIKFGAAVRTSDFRYWWVLPGAIATATALWYLLTVSNERSTSARLVRPIWPGMVFGAFVLLLLLVFAVSSGPLQVIDERAVNAQDWWIWLLLSVGAVIGYYGLVLVLPPPAAPSRLAYYLRAGGAGATALLFLAAIFFTQSRGPWIGTGTALFVFFSLLLFFAANHARARNNVALATRLRLLLGGWVALTLAVGGFLIVFNLSNAPFFVQLRDVPYIGRMGRLLEIDEGTGKVRSLIWAGDEHAGGAVQLITSDPVRSVIGWGPESMFVAFNRFYPPSLANIESRDASPDRSHQALLDELVTKGLLGLVSYFFVLISGLVLCWRMIRRSDDWRWQLFFMACFSIIVGNFVDGLTGIPIVSTLMMFWVTLGIAVVSGMLAGQYTLGAASTEAVKTALPSVESPPLSTAKPKSAPGGARPAARRGAVARGATVARRSEVGSPRRGTRGQTNPAALAVYSLVMVLTLGAVWWFNLTPVYADMRFQQGKSYSEQQSAGLNVLILGMDDYLATIRGNPREDFYYLNLGRVLMTMADELRNQGAPMGQADDKARVETLLRLRDAGEVQIFVKGQSPLGLMSYAEAVLNRARELNSMNKDHYANLARLNNFWYSWTQDPTRLQAAATWYEKVNAIAPQDVALINERASVLGLFGNYSLRVGKQADADAYYAQAWQLLEHSKELDARYADTDARMADIYRLQGKLPQAVDLYVNVINRAPHQLDPSVEQISFALQNQPELLRKLRDAYAQKAGKDALLHAIAGLLSIRLGELDQALTSYQQAIALQPRSVEYRRNYTLVLSDTLRYTEALSEAKNTLALVQNQPERQAEAAQLQALISFLQQKVAGGQ